MKKTEIKKELKSIRNVIDKHVVNHCQNAEYLNLAYKHTLETQIERINELIKKIK